MRHDRDALLARVDLEALADELLGPRSRPAIRMWPCPNPDHAQTGRTPPLSVFPARSGHQRWHCHGCGEGGTAIDLLLATRHAHDVRDALDWLAHRVGLEPQPPPDGHHRGPRPVTATWPAPGRPRQVDPDVIGQLDAYAAACVEHLRSPAGRVVRAWLTEWRAIPVDVIDAAGIGADPGPHQLARPDGVPRVFPAVVFPVRVDDHVIYTVSRHLRPVASRWWNTAERVNPRLAFYDPPGRPAGGIVVTEGPIDALSALAAGYQAAAILGAGTIPQRLQITDELWVGAGDRHFIRHMQRCQKLGRSLGVANIQIAHKVTDAAAQTADGTAEAKIAAGLLADADTKIILRQDPEQLAHAQRAFGLTDTERAWIGALVKGRALWLIGGHRAVVQHHLSERERHLVDTDQRMRGVSRGLTGDDRAAVEGVVVDAA
jgi:hypothetical protein